MTTERKSLVLTLLVGAALLAALWLLAIGPKRTERAEGRQNVAAQEARLRTANQQVAAYTASRARFSSLLSELRRLDKAVPSRGAVSTMLRQLQRRARSRGSDLRLVALKDGAGRAADGATATPATPGAIPAAGGLSMLPFTFEFTGSYRDLVDILATVRRSVRAAGGKLKIDGRLLTVDGVAFKRVDPDTAMTKAIVNATAYIASEGAPPPRPPVAQPPVKRGT